MEMRDICNVVVVSKKRRLELASVSTHRHRSRAYPRHHRSRAGPCHHRSQTRPVVIGIWCWGWRQNRGRHREERQRRKEEAAAKRLGFAEQGDFRASAVDCVEESSNFERDED
ncbi:hypothetical protein IGI04_021885 [Brassica rapa subsp. trilocularis]|uniref:Uncharacterized protein n=1 Tax=Brassica rapa subsp. trilocularis TaxID=1813537 RepID=A0ABQ7LZC8_BRACM|nr:hypothetical protein IGI04_021885 [Brassica rapa subsp. trilocularis]